MAAPEDRLSEQERLQQLHQMEQVLNARALELQQLLLSMRTIRTQERLIMLLSGAIYGIIAYKAWVGL